MHVTIGEVEVDLSSSGVSTLGDLIEAVQDAATDKNEVIVGVVLNGETLNPDTQTAQQARELEPDDRIEFAVQDAWVLLTAALEETRSGLPELKEKLEQVAASLQAGSRQEAFSLFSECLMHWRQVVHLFQVSQACLGYDPKEIEVEGRSLDTLNEELLTTLQQTKEAMEHGDLVMLSDLIEYELANQLRQEETLLEHLIGLVPGGD